VLSKWSADRLVLIRVQVGVHSSVLRLFRLSSGKCSKWLASWSLTEVLTTNQIPEGLTGQIGRVEVYVANIYITRYLKASLEQNTNLIVTNNENWKNTNKK
jgi:hypothetical protein